MLIRDARWRLSADVVVVGLGGAGAVAAIAAHDQGAQVLVVEKQPQSGHHTNTSMSGGVFINVADVGKAKAYMEALCRTTDGGPSWTDSHMLDVWAHYSAENAEWLASLGGKVTRFASGGEHPQLPGEEAIEVYRYAGSGVAMQRFLISQVEARGIRVIYRASARRLLTGLSGEVEGVRVELEGEGERQAADIRARRGVILTCGGFEFDEEMKLNYLKVYPTYFTGTPANTGDGVRMAQEVGAKLWHMNCCAARWVAKFPDFPIAFSIDLFGRPWGQRALNHPKETESCGCVVVDRDGKRFTSENFKNHAVYYELTNFDTHRLIYPRVPCFWVFDQKRMDFGRLVRKAHGAAGPSGFIKWSNDGLEELKRGWIIRADSVGELAPKLGVPPENLEETVRRWNGYCETGRDPEFDRNVANLVPLRNPPYYGMPLYPGGPNTQGGPQRNERAQVLNVDGDPIPRLYSAGELGSPYGMLYPSAGGNLADCIAFGRLAGEGAAGEKPRG